MKKYVSRLVKLTDEAVAALPSVLAAALPAGHMAYAVRPEEDGSVLVCDAPDTTGRLCAYVPASGVEPLPKTTAKSPRCTVSVRISEDPMEEASSEGIVSVAVPEGLTDEELLAVIGRSAPMLGKYAGMSRHEAIAAYLTEYGPGEASVVKADLEISLVL